MGLGKLSNKVSASDVDRVRARRNPPEYEEGYSPDGDDDGGADFSFMFDDIDFGDSGFDTGGDAGGGISGFGSPVGGGSGGSTGGISALDIIGAKPAGGASDGFGSGPFGSTQQGAAPFGGGISGFGNPVGGGMATGTGQMQGQTSGTFEKVWDGTSEAVVAMARIAVAIAKNLKLRTADELGVYSKNLMIASAIMAGVGVGLSIIGAAADMAAFKFGGVPLQLVTASALTLGTGLMSMGSAAISLNKRNRAVSIPEEQVENIERGIQEMEIQPDDSLESMIDELFGSNDEDSTGLDDYRHDEEREMEMEDSQDVDYDREMDNIQKNVITLNREFLFDTFKGFFPTNTPGFEVKREIDVDSDEFATLETICLKALAAASRFTLDNIESHLERALDTYFSYEIWMGRVKGLNRLDDIEREITTYFRESSDDMGVSCSIDLEGDFYRIKVNKGISAIVTFGDAFNLPHVVDYFKDTSNKLPIIAGIAEDGTPVLADARNFDTMMIAGKARSGKSWSVLSLLVAMMAFNTPEDVSFLIIDPKESNLFKVVSLMPHVCGLHTDENILQIMRDLIDNEGARRKKLLQDNGCDDIWDLRQRKKIMLPVLYLVIDEVMTIKANLGEMHKEFFELLKIIISQLPALGIRIIMVPHRAQGVVDKTVRSLIQYKAAIMADDEVVKETLGITRWNKPLIKPGDTAIILQDTGKGQFVIGAAVSPSNSDNMELLTNMARAYYKMGVEIPDMSSIGIGYNRDEEYIRDEIGHYTETTNKVQFDIDSPDWGGDFEGI